MSKSVTESITSTFVIWRGRDEVIHINAEYVADPTADGRLVQCMIGDQVVGEVVGPISGWWMKCVVPSAMGRKYHLEFANGFKADVVADQKDSHSDPRHQDVFWLNKICVATFYEPRYSAWWIDE
ncbi:MAG: hypothetical protein OXP75_18250 [Rhodospirillales bacterium]|nr:hypothetical protein [Rhodospirillales bacterium]